MTSRSTTPTPSPRRRAEDTTLHEDPIRHVFVYGTLRPGDVRWHHLAPFVVDDGWIDTIPGSLFDTGLDYPAALVDDRANPDSFIVGHCFGILEESIEQCLVVLDEVEGIVERVYRRVVVTTATGVRAWAYEYGDGVGLEPIDSGDWFVHRPPPDRVD